VRHELVNVLLELVLDVENPNPFPVEFSAASYRFHGEGRKWAAGKVDRPVTIPARGTAEVRLPIPLNFTETGRDLFDLVAKLRVVRFRLEGQARVTAPISFLPEFRMDFDRTGAVQVERTLPAGP
jgi:LEA14-like dessication related protein